MDLLEWEQCAAMKSTGLRCENYFSDFRHPDGVRMCKYHSLRRLRGGSVATVPDEARVEQLNTTGGDRFKELWLGVNIRINTALRQSGVYDGEAPVQVKLAAMRIAWSWCLDLEYLDQKGAAAAGECV